MSDNVSKSQFKANAALNAQEFANRQILLKGSGDPSNPAPFGATYIDKTTSPPKVYRQIDLGIGNNWVIDSSSSDTGVNGAVFITDVTPQDPLKNVGQKVFSSDDNVLDAAVANTELLTVSIVATIGHTNYKPTIQVNGQTVDLAQHLNQSFWIGTIDIDLQGQSLLTATHEDGAKHEITITPDNGAEIHSAVFTGGYPLTQTELKAGDQFQLEVNTDQDMVRIEIEDFGAAQSEIFDFPATSNHTITLTIADRGNSPQALGVKLRAMNANGSFGKYFETTSQGSDNGVHTVVLNNEYPAGIIDAIQYPSGQLAIKNNEQAQVDVLASGYDQILYESPNAELQITDPNVFQPFKSVTRIAGDYNVDSENIRIVLTRLANGAVTTDQAIVQIAHVDPQITITEPVTRLRSGGNHGTQVQNHLITLNSNQELIQAPVITVPHGTLDGNMVDTGDKKVWTQNLRVHDNDQKGIFQFGLTQAINLAGKPVSNLTGDNNYELGGFVSRTLTVTAFQSEIDLLVQVSDTSKVVARDKDLILLTYKNNLLDALRSYTITGPSGTLNIKGNLFTWTDLQAVNNNSTGLATITIEEVV